MTNSKKKKILYIILAVAVVTLIFISICTIVIVNKYSNQIEVGVGQQPTFSHIENNGFISAICKIDYDTKMIDTSKIGYYNIPIKFFGLFKKNMLLTVVDNLSPSVITKDVYISKGKNYTADLFISSYFDHSEVSFSLSNCPNDTQSIGQYTLSLLVSDVYGNTTNENVNLFITNDTDNLTFEYGVSEEEILSTVNSLLSEYPVVNMPKIDGCGHFEITASNDTAYYLADIVIKDTIPPEAWVKSFDIPLGNTLTEDDIICDIKDQTNVSIEINHMPDFKTPGEYTLEIKLKDEFNNVSTYQSTIRIHDINTEVLAYKDYTDDDIISLIFKDSYSKSSLHFQSINESAVLKTGLNKYEVVGEFSKIAIKVYVDDGTPPYFHVNNISKPLNSSPSPEDFISYYYDATKITFSFEEPIDTSEEGVYSIGILGTDKAGYSSVEYALLTIFEDTRPPKIYGVQDLYLALGQTSPNYLSGITALDTVTENIKVTVDASNVQLDKEGTYTITYKASDEAGNITEVTANVIVTEKIKVRLNVLNILQKPNLPNGCEVVSLCIVLNYLGYQIDPLTLYYDYMPQLDLFDGNPWYSYIGEATDIGFGCYAPCVVTTGNDYIKTENGSHKVYDVSGKSLSEYEEYLEQGIPVIMWGLVNMNGNDKRVWDDIYEGEEVVWHSFSHCLVLIGYTEDGYIFCDPLAGIREYSKEDVEKCFEINFRQACIVK